MSARHSLTKMANASEVSHTLLIGLGIFAALAASVWLYYAEPWYRDEILREMRAGPRAAPLRDETLRVKSFFPLGMPTETAKQLLSANGFQCEPFREMTGDQRRITCLRKSGSFACGGTYTIDLDGTVDGKVVDMNASSYLVCL